MHTLTAEELMSKVMEIEHNSHEPALAGDTDEQEAHLCPDVPACVSMATPQAAPQAGDTGPLDSPRAQAGGLGPHPLM